MADLSITAFPKFVVIKSVQWGKYLRVTDDPSLGLPAGYLKFSQTDVTNQDAKFELEMPESTEAYKKGLTHIRCCHNNKYLVSINVKSSSGLCGVVAGSEKPEENQVKSSCTLFKIEKQQTNVTIRNVYSGKLTCFWEPSEPFWGGMFLVPDTLSPDKDKHHLFKLVDWEDLVVLPKYVLFKGDNGKYMSLLKPPGPSFWPDDLRTTYLLFQQFVNERGDKQAVYEVIPVEDGCIRIKSVANGMYWKDNNNGWILADSTDESSNNKKTLFKPVRIANTTNCVALLNIGNNRFCRRYWNDSRDIDVLRSAAEDTMDPVTKFVVEDYADSRGVFDVKFDISRKRIYDEKLVTFDTQTLTNDTYDQQRTLSYKITEKLTKTEHWNYGRSLMVGGKVAFDMRIEGKVLKVGGGIEWTREVTTSDESGGSKSSELGKEFGIDVPVPPRTKMSVYATAIRAKCEIPYSYKERVTYPNNKEDSVVTVKNDGVYSTTDYFEVKHEVIPENLP